MGQQAAPHSNCTRMFSTPEAKYSGKKDIAEGRKSVLMIKLRLFRQLQKNTSVAKSSSFIGQGDWVYRSSHFTDDPNVFVRMKMWLKRRVWLTDDPWLDPASPYSRECWHLFFVYSKRQSMQNNLGVHVFSLSYNTVHLLRSKLW